MAPEEKVVVCMGVVMDVVCGGVVMDVVDVLQLLMVTVEVEKSLLEVGA